MCVFGINPKAMLDLPGPKGWKPKQVPKLDDISFGIIGWRTWSLSRTHPNMLVGSFSQRWLPNKSMDLLNGFGSDRFGRKALTKDGYEGVYAYKSEQAVRLTDIIWGEVLLWGSVAEYKTGYRAQYAYPLSFFAVGGDVAEYLKEWAEYGVYVNIYSPETEGADEYGYIEYA